MNVSRRSLSLFLFSEYIELSSVQTQTQTLSVLNYCCSWKLKNWDHFKVEWVSETFLSFLSLLPSCQFFILYSPPPPPLCLALFILPQPFLLLFVFCCLPAFIYQRWVIFLFRFFLAGLTKEKAAASNSFFLFFCFLSPPSFFSHWKKEREREQCLQFFSLPHCTAKNREWQMSGRRQRGEHNSVF